METFNADEILKLLTKYMEHLVMVEGSTFISCINYHSYDVEFTDKEVKLLKELSSNFG